MQKRHAHVSGRSLRVVARTWVTTVMVFLQVCGVAAQQPKIPILEKKTPIYAGIARQARLVGDVHLVATINEQGSVIGLHGSGAHPLLCKIAEDNLRQWKFGPFPTGQKFPFTYEITYTYRIVGPLPAGQPHPRAVVWDLPAHVIITAEISAMETTK
jgi:hypothetical protein